MEFTYLKTPINRYTFKSKAIKEWVESVVEGYTLNLFAGVVWLKCNEVRNDIDPEMPANYHKDALAFVREWKGKPFDTIILDPPYAYRKSMEKYKGYVASPFKQLKEEMLNILTVNSIVITFGYHSVSMGKLKGFQQEHILLASHGGAIHDTIAVVERMVREPEIKKQNKLLSEAFEALKDLE